MQTIRYVISKEEEEDLDRMSIAVEDPIEWYLLNFIRKSDHFLGRETESPYFLNLNNIYNRIQSGNDHRKNNYLPDRLYSVAKEIYHQLKDFKDINQLSLREFANFYGTIQSGSRICKICEKPEPYIQVHRINPFWSYSRNNLMFCCQKCEENLYPKSSLLAPLKMIFSVNNYDDWSHNIYEAAKEFHFSMNI